MVNNWRIFQEVPALLFHEDGLHRHDDRLRCSGLPSSLCTKTVVVEMKTVIVEKNCATRRNRPFESTFFATNRSSKHCFQETKSG
ncbi:hypothetical protein, partial [uncultured Parabacteroides sp.]|uniref:hypothetical protein n=1 Tax=uncultured Parabacteroides sp. TaxID=512312 RepID=UPI002729DE27